MAQMGSGLRPTAWIHTGLLALSLALAASCVSQERYKEALDTGKLYQRMAHDLEQYQDVLEAEVESLRAQLALGGDPNAGDAIESSFQEAIDARLAELEALESRIAGISGDGSVTVVTFDGGYGYRLQNSVLFDSASSEIRPGGRAVLAELAREIQSRPYARIQVRGHTDSDPIVRPETKQRFPHGNIQLSTARAIEVAALLVADGSVDQDRVVVTGFGPNEPVATNGTAEGKQMNRRVEIYVEEEEETGGR